MDQNNVQELIELLKRLARKKPFFFWVLLLTIFPILFVIIALLAAKIKSILSLKKSHKEATEAENIETNVSVANSSMSIMLSEKQIRRKRKNRNKAKKKAAAERKRNREQAKIEGEIILDINPTEFPEERPSANEELNLIYLNSEIEILDLKDEGIFKQPSARLESIDKSQQKSNDIEISKLASEELCDQFEEEKEQTKIKYIGYEPNDYFVQPEQMVYPIVLMPKSKSVIKFPSRGRVGRKGYKEEAFMSFVKKFFGEHFQVFDDRYLMVKNGVNPYEPDIVMINEMNGLNLFIDIEIDEPYQGLNDIANRQPTHFVDSDSQRNKRFTDRGWIVIRFAEIQVHLFPEQCCYFISSVIESIALEFKGLQSNSKFELNRIPQWSRTQAEIWSANKYREEYLGISKFGITETYADQRVHKDSDIGVQVENLVASESSNLEDYFSKNRNEIIQNAIRWNKFLIYKNNRSKRIVKPISIDSDNLMAFCYVENKNILLSIVNLEELEIRDTYYTNKFSVFVDSSDTRKIALLNAKFARIQYKKPIFNSEYFDEDTGKFHGFQNELEISVRTISEIKLLMDVLSKEILNEYKLNENYISAYCHKRLMMRTFHIDRILEIEVLCI